METPATRPAASSHTPTSVRLRSTLPPTLYSWPDPSGRGVTRASRYLGLRPSAIVIASALLNRCAQFFFAERLSLPEAVSVSGLAPAWARAAASGRSAAPLLVGTRL